jgi:hypothetical protein
MQPLAEPRRQFEHPIVGHQHDYVPRRVEHRRANLAGLQVLGRSPRAAPRPPRRRCRRRCAPTRVCSRSSCAQPHPNSPLRLGANPFSRGASSRCSSARARCSLTLTAPSVMPKRGSRFAHVHLFDVPQQHNVTVNRGQPSMALRSIAPSSFRSSASEGTSRQLVRIAGV